MDRESVAKLLLHMVECRASCFNSEGHAQLRRVLHSLEQVPNTEDEEADKILQTYRESLELVLKFSELHYNTLIEILRLPDESETST
jgi:dGTP triphosphohydrolase